MKRMGAWQGLAGRLLPLDVVVAVGLTLWIEASDFGDRPSARLAALLITVPLAWARRQPLPVFFLVLVGIIRTFTSGVPAEPMAVWASVVALLFAAYSVGAHSRYRSVSLAVLIVTATLILVIFGGSLPPPPDFVVPYAIFVTPWLVGQAMRNRQLQADAYRERAARLEREQDYAMQAALAEERGRIARELHDVVAHSVSVMVVQAGAARHVLATSPKQASQALLAVEASGREAMAELRGLLGLLNDDGQDLALAPQPGLDQLPSLIQRVGDAGLPVEMHVEGMCRPLPPGIDLTAYRIVQEALTNALKYSGLARTEVVLYYRETELKVEVLDEGPSQPPHTSLALGRGLVGMRERVALYGGTLEAGPRLERGYAVRAWIPLKTNG